EAQHAKQQDASCWEHEMNGHGLSSPVEIAESSRANWGTGAARGCAVKTTSCVQFNDIVKQKSDGCKGGGSRRTVREKPAVPLPAGWSADARCRCESAPASSNCCGHSASEQYPYFADGSILPLATCSPSSPRP